MSTEQFDYFLYRTLNEDDRRLINEYMLKLGPGEINSFMKRLLNKPGKDILEVHENIDTILVFENKNIANINKQDLQNKIINIINKQKRKTNNKKLLCYYDAIN